MDLKVPQPIKRAMDSLRDRAQRTRTADTVRRMRRRGSHAHGHSHTEEELLARTEEFNRNAETYWQSVENELSARTNVLNLPFGTVQDTPSRLYRLGLVLAELQLGIGHTVVDFGSGSCWLSSCINRLRCQTIAVDVSPTALKLGQELFKLDPRHQSDMNPQFLPYDGHCIALPAESVDRVVCFDSFHHVPNQEEVLREIYRVLKPGGRAVFSEPGEGHSHTQQSIYEVERYGVLENELSMPELIEKCKSIGFTKILIKPYPDAAQVTFSDSEYLRFMEGDDRLYPTHLVRASMRNLLLFVLTKGDEVCDSRNPKVLKADIKVAEASRTIRGQGGSTQTAQVKIKNTGDTLWLHEVNEYGGYVMLGGHLYNHRHELIRLDYFRLPLPKAVAPGDRVDLQVNVRLPADLGQYFIKLDLVDARVIWFEQCGSPTTEFEILVDEFPDSRNPDRAHAEIKPLDAGQPIKWKLGTKLHIPVRITNTGNTTWLHSPDQSTGTVLLGGRLYNDRRELIVPDLFRIPLGKTVPPDESVEVQVKLIKPIPTGKYFVKMDLIAEEVCWFEQRGSAPLEMEVEATTETSDSVSPTPLRANIELREPRRSFSANCRSWLAVPLRITNTGSVTWPHEFHPQGDFVTLGGHLYDGQHKLLAFDFFHTPLPKSLGAGESLDMVCKFEVPASPGRYFVELDMVDEHVQWFGESGSPTTEIEILAR